MVMREGGAQLPVHVEMVRDDAVGLDAAIVLHSTVLGPAAGGCRLWRYPGVAEMTADACRLAEGMSYKNALAGLPLGGGKAVINAPTGPFDRRALFEAFGQAVAALGGRYITAEDVGTTVADMQVVAGKTRHVAGIMPFAGRADGDPSPWTARGVFLSMQHAAERALGRPLKDCTVAIQGVGNVGAALADMLHRAGVRLVVADVSSAAVARVATRCGAEVAPVRSIHAVAADIFAPCALGGVLHAGTIRELTAKVVCGAANNQLADRRDGERLADRGVLYAPDFVVNAGGIIAVAAEYLGWPAQEAARRIEEIPGRLKDVLDRAAASGVTSEAAAIGLAQLILARDLNAASSARERHRRRA